MVWFGHGKEQSRKQARMGGGVRSHKKPLQWHGGGWLGSGERNGRVGSGESVVGAGVGAGIDVKLVTPPEM